MDMDTVWTVVKIILFVLATYLILWAYNADKGYQFYTDTETYDGSVLAPLIDREPTRFDCVFWAIVMGAILPETQKQLVMFWYRFFPPKPLKFEDLKPLN
jgi:hypothetical protein